MESKSPLHGTIRKIEFPSDRSLRSRGDEMTLSVIVVTYNSREDIQVFLESLSVLVGEIKLLETRITDNASNDGTREYLLRAKSEFPELGINLRFNERNVGLSKALDNEILSSRGNHLLICNPDIRFTGSTLNLFRHIPIDSPATPTALVPELLNEDGTVQRKIYRRYPTLTRIICSATSIGSTISLFLPWILRDYLYEDHAFAGPVDGIEQASAVCLLIDSASALALDPFFDPQFPVLWNDVDMIMRAREHGIRFRIVPGAHVYHRLGRSVRRERRSNPERLYMLAYSSRGLIGFARRWKMHPNLLRVALFLDAVFRIAREIPMRYLGRKTHMMRRNDQPPPMKKMIRQYTLPFRCSLR
jgi:GT2 family glycosyltransferase